MVLAYPTVQLALATSKGIILVRFGCTLLNMLLGKVYIRMEASIAQLDVTILNLSVSHVDSL